MQVMPHIFSELGLFMMSILFHADDPTFLSNICILSCFYVAMYKLPTFTCFYNYPILKKLMMMMINKIVAETL